MARWRWPAQVSRSRWRGLGTRACAATEGWGPRPFTDEALAAVAAMGRLRLPRAVSARHAPGKGEIARRDVEDVGDAEKWGVEIGVDLERRGDSVEAHALDRADRGQRNAHLDRRPRDPSLIGRAVDQQRHAGPGRGQLRLRALGYVADLQGAGAASVVGNQHHPMGMPDRGG